MIRPLRSRLAPKRGLRCRIVSTFSALVVSLAVGCASTNSQPTELVEYRRTGGLAGLTDHLLIHSDGTAELTRKSSQSAFNVGSNLLDRLTDFLEAIDFEQLDRDRPAPGSADLFEYTLTCRGHTVRTWDTAIPAVLRPLIRLLNQIVETAPPGAAPARGGAAG